MIARDYFVHESSYVDEGCEIGSGTKIWHFSHIMKDCKIGANCNIGQNVVVSPGVTLGSGVKIQNNVSVYTGVVCEDDVFLGPSCVFTNGASIGANVTIVCGHDIGQYALIGAGSVVTHDIPDYALAYGVPAQVRGYVCQCGEQICFSNLEALCPACGRHYRIDKSSRTVKESK